MKKLVNDPREVVRELLEGLVDLSPDLALLDTENVVVRRNLPLPAARRVAVISGGGSGHEPAHAGYVGEGLLSAAVAGDVFTSPSADAVLAAIEAAAGPAGALLIVKNYTGDRLNFGLAAEMARQRGIPVEMAFVADDVALRHLVPPSQRRGIAGTILVHKLAGAAAEQGASLPEVADIARRAAADLGSIGVGLGSCVLPIAGAPGFDLGEDEIEFGLGIHGEKGVARTKMARADDIVDALLAAILDDRKLRPTTPLALLVNGLGGTSAMELAIVARRALATLRQAGFEVRRAWCGNYLSAMEMPGISLSLLPLDDERDALFDAPAKAPAWKDGGRIAAHRAVIAGGGQLPAARTAARAAASTGLWREVLLAVAAALEAAEPELTDLDSRAGDGDLGASMRRGADAIRAFVDVDDGAASDRLIALANALRRTVAGSSGPFYAIGLLRAATSLAQKPQPTPVEWMDAYQLSIDAIAELGGARPGDRTMLDALHPALAAWREAASDGLSVPGQLHAAALAAEAGAAATAAMVPMLGRASYLGRRALGIRDGGAVAVAIWWRAIAKTLGG